MRLLPWIAVLALVAGCGTPSFLITPIANTNALDEQQLAAGSWGAGKVVIIPVEGVLANAKVGGLLQPTENVLSIFTQELEKAANDASVKAVVLRVNSPGGTVTASDAMYQLLKRFKARTGKPVVASAQEVAASGAYYVSCAADRIVAQPSSLVGSIGVVFETVEIEGTLDKIGVKAGAIKSGSLKDMGSPFRAMKDSERMVFQDMVEEDFAGFIKIVTDNRPNVEKPIEDLTEYAKASYGGTFSGRVWSGRKAKQLGLVDQLGLLEDAVTLAKKLANAPNAGTAMYTRPYGYGGSIYATNTAPAPRAESLTLQLPGQSQFLPSGMYYLWQPLQ